MVLDILFIIKKFTEKESPSHIFDVSSSYVKLDNESKNKNALSKSSVLVVIKCFYFNLF